MGQQFSHQIDAWVIFATRIGCPLPTSFFPEVFQTKAKAAERLKSWVSEVNARRQLLIDKKLINETAHPKQRICNYDIRKCCVKMTIDSPDEKAPRETPA